MTKLFELADKFQKQAQQTGNPNHSKRFILPATTRKAIIAMVNTLKRVADPQYASRYWHDKDGLYDYITKYKIIPEKFLGQGYQNALSDLKSILKSNAASYNHLRHAIIPTIQRWRGPSKWINHVAIDTVLNELKNASVDLAKQK